MERLAADLAEYHLMEVRETNKDQFSFKNIITGNNVGLGD